MKYESTILGWMTQDELNQLASLAKTVPANGRIVEVGSLFGRSAVCWAENANPSVSIHCIDIFYENMVTHAHGISDDFCEQMHYPKSGWTYNAKELFLENTKRFPNITMIQGTSPQKITYDQAPIDLFFLDGAHENPSDWENLMYFLPLIKSNGYIIGHDCDEQFPDIVYNIKRLEQMLGVTAQYPVGSLWYLKKP